MGQASPVSEPFASDLHPRAIVCLDPCSGAHSPENTHTPTPPSDLWPVPSEVEMETLATFETEVK